MSAARKARGAFYTPRELADYLVRWAVRSPRDRVLDPGCGDGVFLASACQRLQQLGSVPDGMHLQLWGVELDPEAHSEAQQTVRNCGGSASVIHSDFFDVNPSSPDAPLRNDGVPAFNAVVGNPPYIRFHGFAGATREKGLTRARKLGVQIPGLASSWAPYLVHATSFLAPGGRLAMVLPAELLTVDYALPVREFLLRRFQRIYLVTFSARVFPGVEEEVVLLLAETTGDARGISVAEVQSAADLPDESSLRRLRLCPPDAAPAKWLNLLLPESVSALFSDLEQSGRLCPFKTFAEVNIGVVTGNKDYFVLSDQEVARHGLDDRWLVRCISKASHIRGCAFTHADYESLRRAEAKCRLLLIPREADVGPDPALLRYIERGRAGGVHTGYKCAARKPWYTVPSAHIPDAFLTYMAGDHPRLALNECCAYSTNTIHSVFFTSGREQLDHALVTTFHSSLSLLSVELCGRSYGGGVLKLETKEAESILVPDLRKAAHDDLVKMAGMVSLLDRLIRGGRVEAARAQVDDIVGSVLGISQADAELCRNALAGLQARRRTRSRGYCTPTQEQLGETLEPMRIAV